MQSAPDGEIKPSVVRGVGAREGTRSGGTSRMQSGGSGGRGGLKGEEGVQVAWRSGEQRNGGRPNGAGVEHWSPRSSERAEGRECNGYGPPGFFLFFSLSVFLFICFLPKKSGSFSNRGRKATSGRRQSPAGCTQPSVLLPVAPSCPGAGSPPSPGARLPPPPAPFYPSSIVVKGFARAVTVPQGPPRPSLLAVSRVLCRGAPRSRPRGSSRGMPPSGRLGFRDEGGERGPRRGGRVGG